MGLGAKAKDVYLVDYGFAKFYNRREAVPQVRLKSATSVVVGNGIKLTVPDLSQCENVTFV